MKTIQTGQKKFLLKVLSVVFAVALWLIVTYSENETIDVRISGIEVKLTGQETLEDRGIVITDTDNIPSVSVVLRGKRSELIEVMDKVTATADASVISKSGEYNITPSFDIPSSTVYISKNKNTSVRLTAEDIIEKKLPVTINQIGGEKNKDFLVTSELTEEYVTVSGAESDIEAIGLASVDIDVSGMSENEASEYEYSFLREDMSVYTPKNPINADKTVISAESTVYRRVSVTVVPNFGTEYETEVKNPGVLKTEIGVPLDYPEELTSITAVPEARITADTTKCVLTAELPEDIYIAEDNRKITVDIAVRKKIGTAE